MSMLLSRLIKRRNTLPPVRLRRQKAPPPPDRLERLSKLVNVFGVTLPLSAVLYGGFQIYLDYQRHQDEMQLKSIEVATTLTTLRAEGKLSLEDEVFMLRTLRALPIDDQMKAVVEKQLSQAQEVVEVKQRLVSAEAESQRLEGNLLKLQLERDDLVREKGALEERILFEIQGRGTNNPGQGPMVFALKAELAKLKEELRLASEQELGSVKQFAETQESIGEQRAELSTLAKALESAGKDLAVSATLDPARAGKPLILSAVVVLPPGHPWAQRPPGWVDLHEGDSIVMEGSGFGAEPGKAYLCGERTCIPLETSDWSERQISATVKDLRDLGRSGSSGYTVVISARDVGGSSPAPVEYLEAGRRLM